MRDQDVRLAVRAHLHSLHEGDSSTRIVEEMGIWSGAVRIDIAVINGELSGFELKSDRDTLDRLPLQADYYSRVFDRLTLVVGTRHVEKASVMLPDWWGITVATGTDAGVTLAEMRLADRNPNIESYLLAQLLWKEEALAVLEKYSLAKGWRSKPAKAIHERLARELPHDALSAEVRAGLKARQEWLRQPVGNQRDMAV